MNCSNILKYSGSVIQKRFAAHSAAISEAPTNLKKFWKEANVKEHDNGYSIMLDHRPLKTPTGSPVRIPLDRKILAVLTAAEWEMQDQVLKSYSLPLTSIVMRSLDSLQSHVIRKGVVDNLLRYVHTDSICYQQDYPESFEKLQKEYWTPIITLIQDKYGLEIKTTSGILRVKQSDKVVQKFRKIITGYDAFHLAAFEKAVLRTKSFMIALALIEREITVEFATMAARLEVHHQIQRWGEVEDSHDVDREDLQRQLGSAVATIIKQ
jgi:ATP synthase mitochondrial F1 complex assembly factor 2